jgi:hypothetical protein
LTAALVRGAVSIHIAVVPIRSGTIGGKNGCAYDVINVSVAYGHGSGKRSQPVGNCPFSPHEKEGDFPTP